MHKDMLRFETDIINNPTLASELLVVLKAAPQAGDCVAQNTSEFANKKGYKISHEDVHDYLENHFKIKISAADADTIAGGSKASRGFDDFLDVAKTIIPDAAKCCDF